jgi:hypothetical protein
MGRKIVDRELRSYFQEWLDTNFTYGLINRDQQQVILDRLRRRVPQLVRELNRSGRGVLAVEQGLGTLTILPRVGSDPATGKFNLFEFRWSGVPRSRRLRCFLGSRFLPNIIKSLRLDLRYVLEPSNIELAWSDMDMSAVGFFTKTLREIRRADFCIFDNREADTKPNVYIEAGIAYVLGKPFIMADYKRNRLEVPSDLQHINRIQYRNYADLSRQIYFRLPVFLRDNRLRGAGSRKRTAQD